MTSDESIKIAEASKRLNLLDELADEHKYAEYIEELNKMLHEFRNLGGEQNILSRRGQAFYELEKFQEAIDDLNKAIELGRKDNKDCEDMFTLQSLLYLGQSYFMRSQMTESLKVWERIDKIQWLFSDSDWLNGLFEFICLKGRTYLRLGKFDEAICQFKEAYSRILNWGIEKQEKYELCYYLALTYLKNNQFNDALKTIEEIDDNILDNGWLPEYLELKCGILDVLCMNQELINTAEQLASLGIESLKGMTLYYSGVGYYRLGIIPESVKRFKAAIRIDDSNGWVSERTEQMLEVIGDKEV